MSEDQGRLIEDESCDEDGSSSREELQNWKRWGIIILFALFNVNMSYQVYLQQKNRLFHHRAFFESFLCSDVYVSINIQSRC